LKQKLTAQINLRAANVEPASMTHSGALSWLRRWWPALAPAGVSLACAVVMVSQQMEARELRRGNQTLEQQIAEAQAGVTASTSPTKAEIDTAAAAAKAEQEEMTRLRERLAQLSNSVARLEKLQAENEALRKQPATPTGFSEDELAAVAKAQERALSIACINNLKQIGLSVRVWAQDEKDVFPPNFLSMSNELGTVKILVCPADTNRVAAKTFMDYTDANCSYEYLTPNDPKAHMEPQRVLTRCPIHGNIGLCDGSVQRGVAKEHPEQLIERDGKLYLHSN
jgi:hypothetical protein